MAPRYERVNADDDEDRDQHGNITASTQSNSVPYDIPASPPPSFHSLESQGDALADSFDAPSDDDDDEDGHDMRNVRGTQNNGYHQVHQETVPTSTAPPHASNAPRRVVIGNDGVFANMSAKPTLDVDKGEELPPTYEQAAADATPPYWETTILAPGMSPDEVFIDGLPVGSVFAFLWNAMISVSFTFVGFLLTYLLHTTHAAKNGSRAGLGVTLIQYGFLMRSRSDTGIPSTGPPPEAAPSDPNSFDFQTGDMDVIAPPADSIGRNEWLSYVLMIVGWFILIRAVSDFVRARKTEQVILASPERGLGLAVVAENEQPQQAV